MIAGLDCRYSWSAQYEDIKERIKVVMNEVRRAGNVLLFEVKA